jgi:hypothetical protein
LKRLGNERSEQVRAYSDWFTKGMMVPHQINKNFISSVPVPELREIHEA